MKNREAIKQYLEDLIKKADAELADYQSDEDMDETGKQIAMYYDLGITDSEVHAHGNSNDCYDSGYDLGEKDGKYSQAKYLLERFFK